MAGTIRSAIWRPSARRAIRQRQKWITACGGSVANKARQKLHYFLTFDGCATCVYLVSICDYQFFTSDFHGLFCGHKLRSYEIIMAKRNNCPEVDEPPLTRLIGPSGLAVYPTMKSDGLGGWQVADPDEVCRLLGYPPPCKPLRSEDS